MSNPFGKEPEKNHNIPDHTHYRHQKKLSSEREQIKTEIRRMSEITIDAMLHKHVIRRPRRLHVMVEILVRSQDRDPPNGKSNDHEKCTD
jgi:hypothetical protein